MRTLFLVMAFLSLTVSIYAQNGTTTPTYDLIYMRDGRGILKGEILVFDEQNGHIVFVDTEGRKYSIARYEYDYFIEDKVFLVDDSDTLIINPRKEHEAEICLGLVAGLINVNQSVTANANYLESNTGLTYIPLGFKISIGKYLNRQNFVGFTADIGLLGEAQTYFNSGLRYVYQYPGYKSNVAFYVPVELQYGVLNSSMNYTSTDTSFVDGGYNYPSYKDIETVLHSVGLHVGQGVAFILPDKRSIKIELTFVKNFILNEKYLNTNGFAPSATFNQTGFRLGILYGL
jgi:hypothetical protein